MNRAQLKKVLHHHVRLSPPVLRKNDHGELMPFDDDWRVEEITDSYIKIFNIPVNNVATLGLDQIRSFTTDPQRDVDGFKHGFLSLHVELTIQGRDISIRLLEHRTAKASDVIRELIAAVGEVRVLAHVAKNAAEFLDAKANSLAGGRGQEARVSHAVPTEHNHCINTLMKLQNAVSAAEQGLVLARNAMLSGEEPNETMMTAHSDLGAYLRSVEAACIMEEPPHYTGCNIPYRAKRELRWEQSAKLLKEAEQRNPQAMLNAMIRQQDETLQKLILKTEAFEIIFDPENPGRQFWCFRTIEHFSSETLGIEYRIKIRNKTQRTLREVKATTETLGPLGAPEPQTSLIFEQTGNDTFTIHPGAAVFAKLFFAPLPLIQAGTLMGSSTAAYGPIRVTLSALDTEAVARVFHFNPLRMGFDAMKESLIY